MPSRNISISLLTLASLLAPGCCCPQLSGRNCNPCCQPTDQAAPSTSLDSGDCPSGNCPSGCRCQHCGPLHGCLSKWLGGLTGDGVPSQQAPDYVSPQPKFHPVPTRPVFEPQLAYLPPELIEPADINPLRPLHGPLHSGNLRFQPAQPR